MYPALCTPRSSMFNDFLPSTITERTVDIANTYKIGGKITGYKYISTAKKCSSALGPHSSPLLPPSSTTISTSPSLPSSTGLAGTSSSSSSGYPSSNPTGSHTPLRRPSRNANSISPRLRNRISERKNFRLGGLDFFPFVCWGWGVERKSRLDEGRETVPRAK